MYVNFNYANVKNILQYVKFILHLFKLEKEKIFWSDFFKTTKVTEIYAKLIVL